MGTTQPIQCTPSSAYNGVARILERGGGGKYNARKMHQKFNPKPAYYNRETCWSEGSFKTSTTEAILDRLLLFPRAQIAPARGVRGHAPQKILEF